MRSPTPPARILVLLVPIVLAGCSTVSPFKHRPSSHETRVEVRNDRFEDMTVYLQREGGMFRLGKVPGKGSTTLTVPADYVRLNCWMRFVAKTNGREQAAVSETFGMGPGSRVRWFIPLTTGETPVLVTPPQFF